MTAFTRENIFHALRRTVEEAATRQLTDPTHPDSGAIVPAATGIAEAGHVATAAFIAGSALCALAGDTDTALLVRATRAADYLLRAQRESGLIDLRNVNHDSPPDTAFVVQQLLAPLAVGRAQGAGQTRADAAWLALAERLETFCRRAAGGVATGGFHTPNHRWVIAGAVAQLARYFPDLAPSLAEPLRAYLAEGFDADAEGAYLERSVGVYDAVTNRSLLLVAENWQDGTTRAAALASVRANLDFDLHLLHADATAETGLSRRQDAGTRAVPISLAAPYLHAGWSLDEPRFVRAAAELWEASAHPEDGHRLVDLLWLAWVVLAHPEPLPDAATLAALPPLPDDYTRLYPRNGLWRVRRGPLSLSTFAGGPRLLGVRYGAAELTALSISLSYFGAGNFIADGLAVDGDTATLTNSGTHTPRRPGYDLPLGRPVPPEEWLTSLPERGLAPRPPAAGSLTIRALPDGCELRYRTTDGMDGTPAQIALDFAPGGVWETGDTALHPQPGQVLFLKAGHGTMRYGAHTLTVGPGAAAHRVWQMRNGTPPPPGTVRVLLTFVSPIDTTLTIRGGVGL